MAKCSIKKYDVLPARVGLIDVDYLRFKLLQNMERAVPIIKQLEEARKKFLKGKK